MSLMDEVGAGRSQCVTVCLCDRAFLTEVSGEFVLPDYQPEIRRLLSVTPTLLPPAKYVGSGSVELSGVVDYSVLYVGGDGGLYSVPLSSEYTLQAPLENMGESDPTEGITLLASPVCETINSRVTAPRRLHLRCRVRVHLRAYGKTRLEEERRGSAKEDAIQRLYAHGNSLRVCGGLSDIIEISTELTGFSGETRVISASGEPFITNARLEDGLASASGELTLKLLVEKELGGAEVITKKLPFGGEVELPEASAEGAMRVFCTVSDLAVRVEEERILCDARLLLEARAMENSPLRYTADLYFTEQECRCENRELRLPVALRCDMGNLSLSERLNLSDVNFPEGAEILDTRGTAVLDRCETNGGKYILMGQSRYAVLCKKEEEYSVTEIELPLRYELDAGPAAPESFDAVANVISCRVRAEEGTVSLDAEIAVVSDFVGSESISPITVIEMGEPIPRLSNGITVYYPAPGETAWEVAKKRHVSPASLTEHRGECLYYLF